MKFALCLALIAVAVASSAAVDDKCSFGCPDVYEPVCGSNGKTYSNSCYLRLESCQNNNEITKAGNRECASTPTSSTTPSPVTTSTHNARSAMNCPDACLDVYEPVTDENGNVYSNECYMKMAKCKGTDDDASKRSNSPSISALDAGRKLAVAAGN
ncbi:Kazal-type serine protease inhibitor domain [Phytophthora infestans]|uniref:Kazal-type serine protease inhibitor domain n=1 Tax=Phytophthora infestans TaxID=4787 RepID=A0A833T415_PHYIN|nr:Kazal-type serine protease inhibitor domain [Phytophthora infestans]